MNFNEFCVLSKACEINQNKSRKKVKLPCISQEKKLQNKEYTYCRAQNENVPLGRDI